MTKDLWLCRLEELRLGYGYYKLDIQSGQQRYVYSFEYTNLPEPGPIVLEPNNSCRHTPRKGDWVEYDGDAGHIAWIAGEDVYVSINGNIESLDRDLFTHYRTPRGRTLWYI